MHAWIADEFGHFLDKLKIQQKDRPKPSGSDAVMRVKSVGLNYRDILSMQGKYQEKAQLPFIPGVEAAGEVVETGDRCNLKKGDRIMTMNSGALAEFMVAPQRSTFFIPKNMSYESASAFQMTYQTSYFALFQRAKLKKNEFLLVNGAAGGVGISAIQIGKVLGARVIAAASTDEKLEVCRKYGAENLINYRRDDLAEKVLEVTDGVGANVIFDPVGGDIFERSLKCIAWEGRIVIIGFASGRIPQVKMNRVLLKNIALLGLYWGNYRIHNPKRIQETQKKLYRMYERKQIEPVIYRCFPFDEAPRAFKCLEERESYGKVVVVY